MITDERIEELLEMGIAKEMPTNLDNRTLARTTAIAAMKTAEERLGIKDIKLYMTFNGVKQTWVIADPPHTHETRPTEVTAQILVGKPSWVVNAEDLGAFTDRIRRALVMRLIGGIKRKDEPDLVIAQVADDGRWASVDPAGDDDSRFDLPLAKGMAAIRDVLISQWKEHR